MTQRTDQPQVLPTGQHLVDGGVLAGQADAEPHRLRVLGDVDAEHARPPAARRQDRREDPDRGRLPGAVGAEEAEHGAGLHREGHAVERDDLPELLPDVFHLDGRVAHGRILAQTT